jgi:hypothetical protein
MLHAFDFATHMQNDLDASQIHAEVARERENRLESRKVVVRVQAGIAFGPGW